MIRVGEFPVFKSVFFGISGLAFLLPGLASAAREPTVLAPLKPWNLHYADNSCQLTRAFGHPAKPTVVALERISPDSAMSLMVFGGGLTARPGSGLGKASFAPFNDHQFENGVIAETVGTRQTAILWTSVDFLPGFPELPQVRKPSDIPPRDLARLAAMRTLEEATSAKVTGLQIVEPRGRTTILQTGSLGKANAMMRECAREQMTGWGLDPDVQDKIVRSAISKRSLADFFSSSDYPSKAIWAGEESIISARLIVDADGKVTNCTSLTVFAAEGFGDIVCRNLSKAVFEPAQLADGTRVPTFVTARIRFKMP